AAVVRVVQGGRAGVSIRLGPQVSGNRLMDPFGIDAPHLFVVTLVSNLVPNSDSDLLRHRLYPFAGKIKASSRLSTPAFSWPSAGGQSMTEVTPTLDNRQEEFARKQDLVASCPRRQDLVVHQPLAPHPGKLLQQRVDGMGGPLGARDVENRFAFVHHNGAIAHGES